MVREFLSAILLTEGSWHLEYPKNYKTDYLN